MGSREEEGGIGLDMEPNIPTVHSEVLLLCWSCGTFTVNFYMLIIWEGTDELAEP